MDMLERVLQDTGIAPDAIALESTPPMLHEGRWVQVDDNSWMWSVGVDHGEGPGKSVATFFDRPQRIQGYWDPPVAPEGAHLTTMIPLRFNLSPRSQLRVALAAMARDELAALAGPLGLAREGDDRLPTFGSTRLAGPRGYSQHIGHRAQEMGLESTLWDAIQASRPEDKRAVKNPFLEPQPEVAPPVIGSWIDEPRDFRPDVGPLIMNDDHDGIGGLRHKLLQMERDLSDLCLHSYMTIPLQETIQSLEADPIEAAQEYGRAMNRLKEDFGNMTLELLGQQILEAPGVARFETPPPAGSHIDIRAVMKKRDGVGGLQADFITYNDLPSGEPGPQELPEDLRRAHQLLDSGEAETANCLRCGMTDLRLWPIDHTFMPHRPTAHSDCEGVTETPEQQEKKRQLYGDDPNAWK